MAAADGFHDFVKELFGGIGRIEIKRMFGGAGGYADGVMFLLIANDTIHIKANDEGMKADLRAEGSGPFEWIPQSGPRAGETLDLGYWRLPDAAMDDPEEAVNWGRRALALAKAKAAEKKPKKSEVKKSVAKKVAWKKAKKPARKSKS